MIRFYKNISKKKQALWFFSMNFLYIAHIWIFYATDFFIFINKYEVTLFCQSMKRSKKYRIFENYCFIYFFSLDLPFEDKKVISPNCHNHLLKTSSEFRTIAWPSVWLPWPWGSAKKGTSHGRGVRGGKENRRASSQK